MTRTPSRTARTAVAALTLALPVVAEAVGPGIGDRTVGHLLFAASQVLGWALLATVVAGAPSAARDASPRGRWAVLVACGLQVAFGLVDGATALDGEPSEAVFVLFLLGFLVLLVGGPLWASRLRRQPGGRSAAVALLVVTVLGLLAVVVEPDPFHDVALVGSYLAWVLVGRGLSVLGENPREPGSPRRADASVPLP